MVMQVLVTVLHPPSCELTSFMHRTELLFPGPGQKYRHSLRCKLTSGDPGGEGVTFSWAQLIKEGIVRGSKLTIIRLS